MAYNFEVLKELDDDRFEIKSFIDSSNKTILDEEIKLKITIINQLMGYYNQILVRVQDIIPKEEVLSVLKNSTIYRTDINGNIIFKINNSIKNIILTSQFSN